MILLPPENYLAVHTTERLTMRPVSEEILPHWVQFMSNETAIRWFPGFKTEDADMQARAWLDRLLLRYKEQRYGFLAIYTSAHEFVGQCGLLLQEIDGEQHLEVGYSFMPQHWGNGYATEAAAYFENYARNNKLANHIVSMIHPENLSSQAVAIRNGLTPWKETVWNEIPVIVFRKALY